MSEDDRVLLELRAGLVLALAREQGDARVIRDRLDRHGRRDAMTVVTGTDMFSRTEDALRRMIEELDHRLAASASSAGVPEKGAAVEIEVDPAAGSLLRRP